jgi:tRNA threonylcarbamoyladenosine biosynthesis protein TsaB
MKVLALELSSARGSLAWLSGDHLVGRDWPNDRKNSAPLFENLLALRTQFGLPDRIMVGLGPGSYAGVRIAISAAIGLQALSNRQLLGCPSICAMEVEEKEYCVIGDARRQSFFFARVDSRQLVDGPVLLAEDELRAKIGHLDREIPVYSAEHLPQFQRAVIRHPSASVLAWLARDSNLIFFEPPLEPMYLRDPYVTMPKPTVQRSGAL